eukprot:scaffold64967_cov55-Attheya_sp.AAC.1
MVAVDCCEGGGLYSYKGITVILLAVKGFQSNEIGITGGRRHQEGCQSQRQPHMMPCSCKCRCIGG